MAGLKEAVTGIKAAVAAVTKKKGVPAQPKDQLLDDLHALRKLFTPKDAWIKGGWGTPGGSSFCMEGGIAHVTQVTQEYANIRTFQNKSARVGCMFKYIREAAGLRTDYGIPRWNDGVATHPLVLATIDKAIKKRMEDLSLWQAQAAAEKVKA